MLTNTCNFAERLRPLMLFGLLSVLPVHAQQSAVDELVAEILRDVVDRTIDTAREDVVEHSDIDLLERGYESGVEYRTFSPDSLVETRRELEQVRREHDREIAMLEDELHRKLERARSEFTREAVKEGKPEKVLKKRAKLERKVEAAYTRFDEKVAAVNARSYEKRDRILSKAEGDGRGREERYGPDEGRGAVNGHGQDRGRGVEDLKL